MSVRKPSKYNKLVRISEDQLNWLKINKDTSTVAKFLDNIINKHKDNK